MHRIDGEGATADNKFTEGNPTTGSVATTVTADMMNALQEEICSVIEAAGITLNKAQNNQLLQAIQSLISGGGVAVSAAGVSIADAAEYFSGTEVEAALQQIGEKIYVGTFNSSQIRRSVITVNSTSVAAVLAHAENILQLSAASTIKYTLPKDTTINFPIGTAIEIVQSGAGKVSFLPESGATLLRPAAFNASTLGQHAVAVLYKVAVDTWRLGGMLEAAA